MEQNESELREALVDINRLRARIEVLEKRLKPKPHGAAKEAFVIFWLAEESRVRRCSQKELAQIAFDAGHALRHKQTKEG